MSYDLLVDRGGLDPSPLGSSDEVHRAIARVFPAVEWTKPGWGVLNEGTATVEFSIPDEAAPSSFGVHLRGEFHLLLERINQLAAANGWSVFDPQDPDGE